MHGPLNVKFVEIRRDRDSSGSGWGRVASWCAHRDGPSGSKKCGEFLGYV